MGLGVGWIQMGAWELPSLDPDVNRGIGSAFNLNVPSSGFSIAGCMESQQPILFGRSAFGKQSKEGFAEEVLA